MAYDLDLRKCVVEYVRNGEGGATSAARLFKVARATINRWLLRQELQAGKPGPTQARKIVQSHLLKTVEQNPELYLSELAEKFNVSQTTIRYHLKQLKISRKKNQALPRKRREQAARI